MTAAGVRDIFFSYGHDKNEEIVFQLKDALHREGYKVWIDKEEIMPGKDWRDALTEGLVSASGLVGYLSRHSVRNPGVCLNELAIASRSSNCRIITVLLEKGITPPLTVAHIQYVDMSDWQEKKQTPDFDAWYIARVKEILDAIRRESSISGLIRGLREKLQPELSLNSYYARLSLLLERGDIDRAWIRDKVDAWLEDPQGKRVFCLTGDPGIGKSVIAAQLANAPDRNVVGIHFCQQNSSFDDPKSVFIQLAFQLGTQLPSFARLLLHDEYALDKASAEDIFHHIFIDLARYCQIDGGQRPCLLIIDALDEAPAALLKILSEKSAHLPHWLRLLVTSRTGRAARVEDGAFTANLNKLDPYFLDALEADNLKDIQKYLDKHLQAPLKEEGFFPQLRQRIEEAAAGNFQYLAVVVSSLDQTDAALCSDYAHGKKAFPIGLEALYANYFAQQFNDSEYEEAKPVLGILAVSGQPVPRDTLCEAASIKKDRLMSLLDKKIACFVHKGENSDGIPISFYHRSLRDWLQDDTSNGRYCIHTEDSRASLAKALLKEVLDACNMEEDEEAESLSRYCFYELPSQLGELCAPLSKRRQKELLSELGLSEETLTCLEQNLSVLSPIRDDGPWEDKKAEIFFLRQLLHTASLLCSLDSQIPIGLKSSLASCLFKMGDFTAAKQYWEDTLEARGRILGEEHPHTLSIKNNLAVTLSDLGDHAAAKKLHEEVLEARRRILGEEHPHTLSAQNNLANALSHLGDHAAAKKLKEEVLEARRRILGEEHPDTLIAQNNLAVTLSDLGDHAAAKKLKEEVLEARRRILGEAHPDTDCDR